MFELLIRHKKSLIILLVCSLIVLAGIFLYQYRCFIGIGEIRLNNNDDYYCHYPVKCPDGEVAVTEKGVTTCQEYIVDPPVLNKF